MHLKQFLIDLSMYIFFTDLLLFVVAISYCCNIVLIVVLVILFIVAIFV